MSKDSINEMRYLVEEDVSSLNAASDSNNVGSETNADMVTSSFDLDESAARIRWIDVSVVST
jgi:hypothetical protein